MRRLFPLAHLASAFLLALSISLSAHAASPLATESSPLLRAYADTPVNWLPWSEAAFKRARDEQKPIFLTVAVFNNELARAMIRQTFANADTAAFLNENFICVAADAKEHPDLVALYQNYLQSVKQLTGLPMNLWLTPELKPFEGANYLPPTEEWGKEGFLIVARRAHATWTADPAAQRRKADEAIATVAGAQTFPPPTPADAAAIDAGLTEARNLWRTRFDTAHAGFGDPPKYPEPELLRFLLADPSTHDIAIATLRALINGATRDPVDGGFFRYATDAEWHLPYLQKLLVDQARIAVALLDAAKLTSDSAFHDAARAALVFVLDQLALENGGFATALDATPESSVESHLWTLADIEAAVGKSAAPDIARALAITADGNLTPDAFPGLTTTGKNLPYRADPATENLIAAVRARLVAHRASRAASLLDSDASSGHHGLLLAALSRAGAELKDDRLATAATAQFNAIRQRFFSNENKLLHLAGSDTPATAADHAMLIEGLRAYATATNNADAKTLAQHLRDTATTRFLNRDLGRFYASAEDPAAGIWARVFAPAPDPGAAPSAEALFLFSSPDTADAVASALLADLKNSIDAPRGDLLLALHAHRKR